MDTFEQYISLISSKIEDETLRNELIQGFKPVQGEYNKVKETRKELGSKLDNALSYKSKVKSLMDFEDDNFTLEDIETKFSQLSTDNNEDVEKIKSDLTSKYENEMAKLASLNKEMESKLSDTESKYKTLQHDNLIDSAGLLDKFQDNPLFKQLGRDHFRQNTLVQDGKLFLNDGDGNVALDLTTREPLTPTHLLTQTKDDSNWATMLKTEQKSNGMNVQPNQANSGVFNSQNQSAMSKIASGLSKL